jgi:RNA polymerase sigma factor (TIGR02999 family)
MAMNVTQLLSRAADGDTSSFTSLLAVVYDELRAMAAGLLVQERPGHTLQATDLVHEAYLKLVDQRAVRYQDRAHFLAIAATAMRRILVDHARTRGRVKRGAGERASLDTQLLVAFEQKVDLLALDEAMTELASVSPEAARVVELRYFGGLSIEETAAALGISDSSVERHWRHGRAWLYRALEGEKPRAGEPRRGE